MSLWIAGITRGHNASVCLLKDGKIVFSIEEERLSRQKYDGGPLAGMIKILDYTKKLDYLVIAHTLPLSEAGKIDYTHDDMYTGLARKLGLIERRVYKEGHPQVIDLSYDHHKLHAACGFYRSGFESATSVIIDGAGSLIPMNIGDEEVMTWELESVFTCDYPNNFKTIYKHQGSRGPHMGARVTVSSKPQNEEGTHELVVDDTGGIVKGYEAVTKYCGFDYIEAGKTMGLSAYGNSNKKIPRIYDDAGGNVWRTTNRNLVIPKIPNGAIIAETRYEVLADCDKEQELTRQNNRRDLAYIVQKESQEEVLRIIMNAVERTGNKNVVLSGGYALNCVANYSYLDHFKEKNINLYVEPISSDAGTSIGAALMVHYNITQETIPIDYETKNLYLGPLVSYTNDMIKQTANEYGAHVLRASYKDVVKLLRSKNAVAVFQGRSEVGPRALGNRSILFDPTVKNGKELVNRIKNREYFRPFAGSILKEYANEWFDMKSLDESPYMMYAVDCRADKIDRVPSITHVDGTCRIQTVSYEQNNHFYKLIKEFYKHTGVPILFNTSFNLAGEPLVETLDDAIRTLSKSDITYLYLPENRLLVSLIKDNE